MGKLKLFDIVIIVVLLALSVIPMIHFAAVADGSPTLKITAGQTVCYYSLDAQTEEKITNNGHSLIVEIKDGSVRVTSSDCDDKICVHSGSISNVGSAIVCLPADIVIEIIDDEEEHDAVAG